MPPLVLWEPREGAVKQPTPWPSRGSRVPSRVTSTERRKLYAAAAVLAGHRRARANSKSPDARQAGTAAHSHGSLPVAT